MLTLLDTRVVRSIAYCMPCHIFCEQGQPFICKRNTAPGWRLSLIRTQPGTRKEARGDRRPSELGGDGGGGGLGDR
jgi:hypothetical protein